jgi:hypothetical protein
MAENQTSLHGRPGAVFGPWCNQTNGFTAYVIDASSALESGIGDNDILLKVDGQEVKQWLDHPGIAGSSESFPVQTWFWCANRRLMAVNLPAMAYRYQVNLSSSQVKSVYHAIVANRQSKPVRTRHAIMWICVEQQAHRINSSLDIGLDCQRQL